MEQSESQHGSRFLEALIADLEPVRPAWTWFRASGAWSVATAVGIGLAILASGPLRVGLATDLLSARFVLELTLGVGAALALAAAGIEIGVPGAPRPLRLLTPALAFAAAWLALTLFGEGWAHGWPALAYDPSGPIHGVIGKRAHCFLQGVAFSLIPVGPALAILRRRALHNRWISGFLIGTAAAAFTAVWMQVACMYEPSHALRLHFSPMLISGVLAAFLATWLLPRS